MAKSIINLTGSYSRWDILNLNVRESDYRPLVPMETMEPETLGGEILQVEELVEKIESLEAKVYKLESALKGRWE